MRRCRTLLVSDAGGNLGVAEHGRKWQLWSLQVRRALDIATSQERAQRRHALVAAATDDRPLGYWRTLTDPHDDKFTSTPFAVEPGWPTYLASRPTRLWPFPEGDRHRLVNWGYLLSDVVLRTFIWKDAGPPDRLPFWRDDFADPPPGTPRGAPNPVNAVPATADVVVIGGGIAGASDAFFLARAGLSVVVIERGEQLAGLTTAQSVACFRAQWDEPDYAALVHPSIDFYGSFAERVGLPGWDIGLHRNGWLFVTGADDGPSVVAEFVAGHRRLGVEDSEALDGDEARKRFAFLGPDVTAASFRAEDGWVSPYEVTYGFAKASGATFSREPWRPGSEPRATR